MDFFAGAGGLSCGLDQAGFDSILANEWIPQYAATFKHNYPNSNIVVGDIRSLLGKNLRNDLGLKKGELDLLAGGPPCQGFSINAPIRTLDDERNHLFKDYLRIAEEFLPKAIIIENVPGMVSLGQGTVVEQIYYELKQLGYSVGHRIMFAGHFGVPQMRFRTIFIAIKGKTKIEFPEPQYSAKANTNFTKAKELCQFTTPLFESMMEPSPKVGDVFGDLPPIEPKNKTKINAYLSKPLNKYQKYLRSDSGKEIKNHYCNRIADVNIERLKHIPQGGSWRDIPFDLLPAGLKRARRSDHTRRYGRLHPDQLCSTILTKCDPHWGSFFHPFEDRVLSVREAARIQSFPDTYEFLGSTTEQYEQVGNAVPPLLGRAIGIQVRKLLGEEYVQ